MRKSINRCGKYSTAIIGKFSTAIYNVCLKHLMSFLYKNIFIVIFHVQNTIFKIIYFYFDFIFIYNNLLSISYHIYC